METHKSEANRRLQTLDDDTFAALAKIAQSSAEYTEARLVSQVIEHSARQRQTPMQFVAAVEAALLAGRKIEKHCTAIMREVRALKSN